MESPEKKLPDCRVPVYEEITVTRSKRRRRIGIKLKNDGTVELLVPYDTPENRLKTAFRNFVPWLEKNLRKLAAVPEDEKPYTFEFRVGGRFFFCGSSLILEKSQGGSSNLITLQGNSLQTPQDDPLLIQKMLEAFYRRHARRIICARLEQYSKEFGFAMPQVNINGARRRFGSCNSRKELNFSWHLAMYPMELIELVVLHECAHFREMNHSPAFYRVLSEYLPDHKQRNKELNKWSRKLSFYPK